MTTGGGADLVSVVITAYNAGATIERALASVAAQSHAARELIVVDDGSTDETAALVQRLAPDARLIRQANQGVSVARNVGVDAARGVWIAFLDSDDYWHPDKLARQLDFARRHAGVRMITCNSWRVMGERVIGTVSDGARVIGPGRDEGVVSGYFTGRARYAFHNSSVLFFARDLVREHGGFVPAYSGNEDSEFIMRLALHGEPVGYIDEPLSYYEMGNAQSLTKRHVEHSRRLADYWFTAEARYPDARRDVLPLFRRTRLRTFFNSALRVLLKTGNGAEARVLLHQYRRQTMGWRWIAYWLASFLPWHWLRLAKRRLAAAG